MLLATIGGACRYGNAQLAILHSLSFLLFLLWRPSSGDEQISNYNNDEAVDDRALFVSLPRIATSAEVLLLLMLLMVARSACMREGRKQRDELERSLRRTVQRARERV